MQKKVTLILISVLGILFGIGWLLGHVYASKLTPARVQSNLPDGNVLKQGLAKENWTFEPLDPARLDASGITQVILTRDQAIDTANKQYPDAKYKRLNWYHCKFGSTQ